VAKKKVVKKKINYSNEWHKIESAIGNPSLKSTLGPEIISTISKMGGWSEIGSREAKIMKQKYIDLRKNGSV
jgi:hypothetical protein